MKNEAFVGSDSEGDPCIYVMTGDDADRPYSEEFCNAVAHKLNAQTGWIHASAEGAPIAMPVQVQLDSDVIVVLLGDGRLFEGWRVRSGEYEWTEITGPWTAK